MALTWNEKEKPMEWQSDRRLYLTLDRTRVVEENDPNAAYLLVCQGGILPMTDAEKYGLVKSSLSAEVAEPILLPEPETKAIVEAPENKVIASPPFHKKRR